LAFMTRSSRLLNTD